MLPLRQKFLQHLKNAAKDLFLYRLGKRCKNKPIAALGKTLRYTSFCSVYLNAANDAAIEGHLQRLPKRCKKGDILQRLVKMLQKTSYCSVWPNAAITSFLQRSTKRCKRYCTEASAFWPLLYPHFVGYKHQTQPPK